MESLVRRLRRVAPLVGLLLIVSAPTQGVAQQWPSKPVRVIVGNTTGGTTDLITRIVTDALKDRIGTVIVENRAGAGGLIAYEFVAKQPPDGYTLLVAPTSIATAPLVNANATYNPFRDFTPIAGIAVAPALVKVRADFPAKNLQELVAYLRANPGKANVALSGSGAFDHLAGIKFALVTGTTMEWIPYKGVAAATPELAAGRADIAFHQWGFSSSFISSGKIRVLATLSAARHPKLPDVPTATEQGFRVEAGAWFGLFGPGGLPRPIVDTLNRETNAILRSAEGQEKIRAVQQEPMILSPDQLAELMRRNAEEWAPVIKAANLKVQ